MYNLRPYQNEAVEHTLNHFRHDKSPALIVLPTGAGKSLVIAELARRARGRVLVMAHVRELVEQNHAKYNSLNLSAGIYSAGLNRKDAEEKVIFGSIQSIARAKPDFFHNFSLVVIDECHRVSVYGETQYLSVLAELQRQNSDLCILGLTATPYRLGLGWIYQFHQPKKLIRTKQDRFFKKCIYELSLSYLIKNNFLTTPVKIDSPVACYDFSSLKMEGGRFSNEQIEGILKDQKRITPVIIKNIVSMAQDRAGVMIFTSSVKHAIEIMQSLPPYIAALVTGETETKERDEIIDAFKKKQLKYLVNVSVLTTGFDAPHVDVIAILRPTESVSLYQQIVGRGLRLSPEKKDCLILDYTGQGHNLFSPEIEEDRPNSNSELVEIICPQCETTNTFWGVRDKFGEVIEHYGRQCQAAKESTDRQTLIPCGYRFRFKRCDRCGAENDIAAKSCTNCHQMLVDHDQKLKEAMTLKDAHIMRVETMQFKEGFDKKRGPRLEVHYYDFSAQVLKEYFYFNSTEEHKTFYYNFIRMHNRRPETKLFIKSIAEACSKIDLFRQPLFVIARKQKTFWQVREKIFADEIQPKTIKLNQI